MKIALTMRTLEAASYRERRNALSADWINFVTSFGWLPIPIPNDLPNVSGYLDAVGPDAVILTGGNDAVRRTCGSGDFDETRNATEFAVMDWSVTRGCPVLGVCRGMHILNLYFGGTVEPDIGREHVARDHEVTACSGAPSRIADRFPLVTNSFHEQAVVPDRLGADLCCLATSKDGFVEAFMHRTQPIFGVQWHPERPNRAADFDRWAIESLFASDAVNND